VAVENDYNLLVFNLQELTKTIDWINAEVQRCLAQEAEEGLEPNATDWVSMLAIRLVAVVGPSRHLQEGADRVLRSRPGVAVFDAQPPSAPEFVNETIDAARQFWDRLALSTEHEDIDKVEAFRRMCLAAIQAYDGTDDQHIADWAREALRLLDERRSPGSDEFLIDDE
jgi:hypothetical protein